MALFREFAQASRRDAFDSRPSHHSSERDVLARPYSRRSAAQRDGGIERSSVIRRRARVGTVGAGATAAGASERVAGRKICERGGEWRRDGAAASRELGRSQRGVL